MTVTVEPGIVLDTLNAWLRPHGVWFPVDVSTSAQATLGGMAGNNSCGSRSIAYGNMVHNVLAIDALLADGTEARFGAEATMTRRAAARARRSSRRCARSASASATRSSAACRRCCAASAATTSTSSIRRASGRTRADGSVNLAHLLVGSEGTLAWTRALTLKLAPLPRASHARRRRVSRRCIARWRCAQHIVRLGPSAVELVDRTMIELARGNPGVPSGHRRALVGEPDAILLVEFIGDDARGAACAGSRIWCS